MSDEHGKMDEANGSPSVLHRGAAVHGTRFPAGSMSSKRSRRIVPTVPLRDSNDQGPAVVVEVCTVHPYALLA